MRVVSFLKYIVLFTLFCVCFLVYTLPASFAWQTLQPLVEKDSKLLGVSVNDVAGTIWHGQALIQYQNSIGLINWRVRFSQLLKGQTGLDLSLDSDVGRLSGTLWGGLTEQSVIIDSANVDLKRLNSFLVRQKVVLDGELLVKNVLLVRRDKKIADSIGVLSWTGGNISYPAGRDIHVRDIPPFRGEISWQEPVVHLGIRDDNADFDVISVTLDQAGWLKVSTKKRLLDIAQEPWPSSTKEDQPVFSLRQKIF